MDGKRLKHNEVWLNLLEIPEAFKCALKNIFEIWHDLCFGLRKEKKQKYVDLS